MNYQDKYETLKHAIKLSLENYERTIKTLPEDQRAEYTHQWFEGAQSYVKRLEKYNKEVA